jgi:hypothetical protein
MTDRPAETWSQETLTDAWWSAVFGAPVRAGQPSRIGDGLVGMNLRYRLEAGQGTGVPSTVVVKLPSLDETSRATGIALRNYEREVKFYEQVADTVDIRVPECHFAAWEPDSHDFVIVLEDVAPAEQGNQISGCEPETARLGVDEMVRLHGPRWDDPTLDELDWIQRRETEEDANLLAGMYAMVKEGFLAVHGDAVRNACGDEGVDLVHQLGEALVPYVLDRPGPRTVTHGDFRLDNMLFGPAGGDKECVVVDWQTPTLGNGPTDLAYFLGAGLVPEDRRRHEDDLLARYAAGIADYGAPCDADWVARMYRHDAVAGVIMAVVASQIVQRTERGDAMFAAMATRHVCHALDARTMDLL